MKTLLSFSLFLIMSYSAMGQAPNWIWANNATGLRSEEGNAVAVDKQGNVVVTGFYDDLSSGPYTIDIGSTTLTSKGGVDVYVAKYNSAGQLLWAKTIGGVGEDRSTGIATDTTGNIYVCGYFNSATIYCDSLSANTTSGFNVFVCKFNSSGVVEWINTAGGSSADYCYSIAVEPNGNGYLTGMFKSPTLSFGTIILNNQYATFSAKLFIAKFSPAGNWAWAKTLSDGVSSGNGICLGRNSDLFLTGSYSGTAAFDTTSITSSGSKDIFIARYDTSGNPQWVKSIGGALEEGGNAITCDIHGNAILTGFTKSISLQIGGNSYSNSGSPDGDILIIQYNLSGALNWARKATGYSNDTGLSIASDGLGNTYTTGYYNGSTLSFGAITINSASVTTSIGDMFVVKYDSTGQSIWAKNLLASTGAWGKSIAADSIGNCYITGFFEDATMNFGSTVLSNTSFSFGWRDMYVGKIIHGGTPVSLHNNLIDNSLAVYPNPSSGKYYIHANSKQVISYEVYTSFGALIDKKTVESNMPLIDLEQQPKGVYFLKIKNKENSIDFIKLIRN